MGTISGFGPSFERFSHQGTSNAKCQTTHGPDRAIGIKPLQSTTWEKKERHADGFTKGSEPGPHRGLVFYD